MFRDERIDSLEIRFVMKKDEIHITSIDLVESFIKGISADVGNWKTVGMDKSSPPAQISSACEYQFICGCEW